jgi:hypothetical protein
MLQRGRAIEIGGEGLTSIVNNVDVLSISGDERYEMRPRGLSFPQNEEGVPCRVIIVS